MKYFYIGLLLLWSFSPVYAQIVEPIFGYSGDSIIVRSKYIAPFYFEDQNTPRFLFKTFEVFSKDRNYSYVVKLSNYKGTENDGGYYRIVDIEMGGKKLLSLKQLDGWDSLKEHTRKYATNDYFLIIPLTDTSTALIFVGYPYQSQPELLTIVVVNEDHAALIYNKQMMINDIQYGNGSFVMVLQDFPIEYINETTPANTANIFKIFLEDGVLKFGGSYGKVKK